MQVFDQNDKLIRSKVMEKINDLEDEMNDPKVKHVTVGKLPYKGDEVRVNGLLYRVLKRDKKNRQIVLELL